MYNKNNMGKQVKDLGVLLIIVGIVMLGIILIGAQSQPNTAFYVIADRGFIVLLLGGLLSLLFGVIIRSIGRSKELKYQQSIAMQQQNMAMQQMGGQPYPQQPMQYQQPAQYQQMPMNGQNNIQR